MPVPLTEPEKHLINILELVRIEKRVPVSARAFVAKSVLRYQHTRSLRHALLSTPSLRMICGFGKRGPPSEAIFSRTFDKYARQAWGPWFVTHW
ncbi:MAG: hypothetical protein K0A93_02410 [Desulfuromonadaceae bacterium]|nr:hypothetical protein [Desulfuromonadaceae bacterium]